MMRKWTTGVPWCVIAITGWATAGEAQEAIGFQAADGHDVFGYVYRTDRQTRGLIVAFHQGGGDGRGEYGPIAPHLNEMGFDVLAVDQRNGGDVFGGVNRTLSGWSEEPGYCEAYADLAGALTHARSMVRGGPVILWGSSYSAALVLRLAALKPTGVSGVLAFSPATGVDCRGEDLSGDIRVPVLVLRPAAEMERESSRQQAATLRAQGHEVFVAHPGTHGSSMLVEERVDGPVAETWERVQAFLEALVQH